MQVHTSGEVYYTVLSGVDGRIIIMASVQEAIGCVYAVATCKMGYNDEVQFQSGVDGRVIINGEVQFSDGIW